MLILCLKVGKLRFGGIYADFKGNTLCFIWLNISLLQGKLAFQTHSFPLGNIWLFFNLAAVQMKTKESLGLGLGWSLMEKKQLLRFLQPLLVFPLQRDRRGVDTPQLMSQALLGMVLRCHPAADTGGLGKTV